MPAQIADAKEAKAFLDAHPQMQFFDLVYTGLSGVPRGKRLRRHELMPLYENGAFCRPRCWWPTSLGAMSNRPD
jgi:hypothetical protein